MTTDISLTGAQRLALIDLKDNATLSSRTQRRLSSGRKINSVIDDSVNYFKSKALEDRAKDFNNLKNEISQAVSHLQVTLEAINGLEGILGQMKGILEAARSQSTTERNLADQAMETLGNQFRELVNDASYGGANLLNSTTQGRTVRFGMRSSSRLELPGLDFIKAADAENRVFDNPDIFDSTGNNAFIYKELTAEMTTKTIASGVTISAGSVTDISSVAADFTTSTHPFQLARGTGTATFDTTSSGALLGSATVAGNAFTMIGDNVEIKSITGGTLTTAATITTTSNIVNGSYNHNANTLATGDTISGATVTYTALENGVSVTKTIKDVDFTFANAVASTAGVVVSGKINDIDGSSPNTLTATPAVNENHVGLDFIGEDNENVDTVDIAVARLEKAISRLRGHAQSLGSNVAILQARESFTDQYVTLNTVGSEKYTLADLNQEGANLVALQTRQQLGIQSLAVAGQQQRAILTLLQ